MIKFCGLLDFNKFYGTRKIVCIGEGKIFHRIIEEYNWNIIYSIDNDVNKNNTVVETRFRKIYVKNWQFLVENVQPDWLILITTKEYESFLFDIIDNQKLCMNDIFIYSKFQLFSYDENRLDFKERNVTYRQKDKQLIPKKIHFFWFSGDEYPDKVKKCIESWYKYCPDYEIKKWDLNNYNSDNVFFNEAIRMRKWAFASDYARADIIYKEGGIYLDSDVEIVKSLDDLLYHDAYIGFEDKSFVDPGSGYGAVKGNRIVKKFRDMYKNKHFILDNGEFNVIPCPRYYTDILIEEGLLLDGSFQLLDGIAVYPVTAFCPHSYVTDMTYVDRDTYSIHHHNATWKDEKEMNQIKNRYNDIKKHWHMNK